MSAKPLKLLFVTAEKHPSFRADVRVLFGKYLPRFGIGSDLVAQAQLGSAPAPWPAGRTWLAPAGGNRWARQLRLLRHDLRLPELARQGYSAVQVRDRVLAAAIGLWAARRARIPFFYWASYPKPESRLIVASKVGLKDPVRWVVNQLRGHLSSVLLYRWVLPRADHVFVQSEAMKQAFVDRGICEARMTAVPMGVDMEVVDAAQTPQPTDLAGLEGRRLIVYAGALDAVRQPGLMLDAMAEVVKTRPEALLLMVGGAPEAADMAALRARVHQLRLENQVHFTGWVSPEQVLGWIAQAELGLSVIPRGPLYDVSSPTKLVEYFALGLSVIANDLPDQALVLAESGAGVCVPFEASAMAAAMLDSLADPERSRARGRAGYDYIVAHRSYDALSRRLAEVYRRLLSR